jgi:hypothetical protein
MHQLDNNRSQGIFFGWYTQCGNRVPAEEWHFMLGPIQSHVTRVNSTSKLVMKSSLKSKAESTVDARSCASECSGDSLMGSVS